ncbi:MAG: transposase [Arenimonas sp.]|nr:transposase [Arenimonas sp.]MBP6626328.1 transposase [Arenimonas sp.]
MPRAPRPDLPQVAQHIVQRGNNRQACFANDDDRQAYLQALAEGLQRHDCALHAYVLMGNHTHLLITPAETGSIARLMQSLGRRYAGLYNHRHGRTGTLWEGRYWSCLVQGERYALACCRYIELNPVRAGMAAGPGDYGWSSYRANGEGAHDPLVTPHPTFLALAERAPERHRAYRTLVDEALGDAAIEEIRRVLKQRGALGNRDFCDHVSAKLRRFVGTRDAHRPARTKVSASNPPNSL